MPLPFAKTLALFRGRKDPDERLFVSRYLVRREARIAFGCTLNAAVFHVTMLVASPWFFSETATEALRPMHLVTVVITAVAIALNRWFDRFYWVLPFTQSAIIGYYGFITASTQGLVETEKTLLSLVINALLFYALRTHVGHWAFLATPVLVAGGAVFAVDWNPGPDSPIWYFATVVAFMIGIGDYVASRIKDVENACQEWVVRSQMTPRSILRLSLQKDADTDALFRPDVRPCVCLSSDWRNYQRLSGELTPAELESVLAHYYQHVQTLLFESFPNGNYFCDWIADELFVVVFGESEGQLPGLVASTLAFCDALLLKKEGLFSLVEKPPGVDVGVAAGTALAGMMGPPDHRKATALGELPGRSRRIQTFGRLLRGQLGETDRVIYGEDVARYLGAAVDHQTFEVGGAHRVRDLSDAVVFFREPRPAKQTGVPGAA